MLCDPSTNRIRISICLNNRGKTKAVYKHLVDRDEIWRMEYNGIINGNLKRGQFG